MTPFGPANPACVLRSREPCLHKLGDSRKGWLRWGGVGVLTP